ncbi:swi5-dependent recombination DNA repair protein 1 homolog [Pholidichthys leucotaenia]
MEVTPTAAKLTPAYSSPCNSVEASPCEYKEEKHHSKLSASLKERLKRTRRSFISPLSVAKRLCAGDVEEDGQQVPADSQETVNNPSAVVHSVDVNRNSERLSGPASESTWFPSECSVQQLKKEIKEKTETLRRLKMVKMYRSKNDLTQLQTLIDKWRSCAQAALYELQSEVQTDGRKATLSELIELFGLDGDILHFDHMEDDFTS